MSNRSKGMQYEREAEKFLQGNGFTTQRVKGSTMFNKNVDFFGLFDLIAFDKEGWLLVQVKTVFLNKVKDEMKAWVEENQPPNCRILYMIRQRRKKEKWRLILVK